MKKFITLTAVLAAALTLSSCDCFKKMAKDPAAIQVSCTPEVLVLNNGKIAADISASIPADYFNKKAALKVTPVLFFEGGAVAGETLLLQGEKVASNSSLSIIEELKCFSDIPLHTLLSWATTNGYAAFGCKPRGWINIVGADLENMLITEQTEVKRVL